jgi:hypothetical protein
MLMTLHHGEIVEFPVGQQGRAQRTNFLSDLITLRNVTNQLHLSEDPLSNRGDRELSGCELLDGITDQSWYLNDGGAQRTLLTNRDLRRLAGLPASSPPSVQLKPQTPKHCGIYRKGEEWLARRLLSPAALAAKVADSIAAEQTERLRIKDVAAAAERGRTPTPWNDQVKVIPLVKGNTVAPLQQPAGSRGEQSSNDKNLAGLPDRGDSLPPGILASLAPPGPNDLATSWSDVLNARNEVMNAQRNAAAFQVEYHKKWAIPLSSFCFVLLGLALALKNPRGGIGLVIGGSLIIFIVFYILIIGGENLAKKMYISPVAAMEGPLIAFTLLGLLSVAGANREMGSTRALRWLERLRARRHRRRDTR